MTENQDLPSDANVAANHDAPLWNETRWNGCWSPEEGVGIYLHMGRFRHDLDMWWAQVVAYLPDGQLCVQRLWGRNQADAGVRLAGLDLQIGNDGWTCGFDGVGELTDTAAMSRSVHGASAPSRSLAFELDATAATDAWTMNVGGSDREPAQHAGDAHIQQGFHTTGQLSVGEHRYSLEGVGFKDHSSGKRDFGAWRGHQFLLLVGPEWTAHLISMAAPDDTGRVVGKLIHRTGEQEDITAFESPRLTDAAGGPASGPVTFATARHAYAYTAERLHDAPLSITEDNDNMNGVNWSIDGDPVVLFEGNARLTSPDGQVIYCFFERSRRRSLLAR